MREMQTGLVVPGKHSLGIEEDFSLGPVSVYTRFKGLNNAAQQS